MRITLGNIVTVATVFETEVPNTYPVQYEPADPTVVNLVVVDPLDVETMYVYGTDIEVTRTGQGAYSADLLPDQLGIWRYRWEGEGAAVGAGEGEFWISSILDEAGFPSFLVLPEDYDGIRALLGVTDTDVTNDELSWQVFAPQAELRVKNRIVGWPTLLDNPNPSYIMRLAAIYAAAALFAESRALGGVIGMMGDAGVSLRRDWPKLAESLWQRHIEWLNETALAVAEEAAVDSGGTPESAVASARFGFRLMRLGGPSRARYTALSVAEPYWWRYPPVIGVPPDWPVQVYSSGWIDPLGGSGGDML
jgi:hypothetical protein